ncbi:MAG: hypothetical protein GY940_06445 [bacterium]|nr:hypothetical protein [bacterium]
MIKKLLVFTVIILVCSSGLFSFEIGLIGGNITKPSHSVYGLSAGMGFLIPMIKFEIEVFKVHEAEAPQLQNIITGGIKLRPKMGKFSPYAIIGIGTEFEKLEFDFDQYEKFTFIGGGVHYNVAGMVSLRADVRFLNYSDYNRTRLTGGIFIHF